MPPLLPVLGLVGATLAPIAAALAAARSTGEATGTPRPAPATVPGPEAAFEDVTETLGLSFRHWRSVPPGFAEHHYLSGGATTGDADGDGWSDVFATRYDDHDLLFQNQGASEGRHAGFADVTASSFAPMPGAGASNGALFFDMDNDADLDLYVTSIGTTRYELWANDGTGRFQEEGSARGATLDSPFPHYGMSAAAGDYDRDGWLDLYVAEWGNQLVLPGRLVSHSRLLHNEGGGFFEDVTEAAGVVIDHLTASGPIGEFQGVYSFSPTFTDLDRDGWPDLAMASDFGTSRLFWNRGDGTFEDGTSSTGVGSDENGMGSTFGDFDQDGDLDWFVSSIFDPLGICAMSGCNWGTTGNRLYRNEGGRRFSDATDQAGVRDGGWGWGSCFLDFDNDADLDLVHTNGIDFPTTNLDEPYETDATRLFENDGEGRMQERAAELGITDTGSGKGLFTFDYDKDGDLDLFVMQNELGPIVYRNVAGTAGGDWLRIELRGTRSNSFGVGAWVRVLPRPGAAPLVRELTCGANYLAQNELALHFGLGRGADRVAEVQVEWPSGAVSVLEGVARNRTLVIREPSAPKSR